MRRNVEPFGFKEFVVEHSQSTLAIGTDAVLLGAWADLAPGAHVLEVGTGCGVISLCLAQRFLDVQVHAIDIDEVSVLEAIHNFKNSPWFSRLSASTQSYSQHTARLYEVIISNPPYFREASKNPERHREIARHQDEFGFENFVTYCTHQTTRNAKVLLVYPAKDLEYIRTLFEAQGWYLTRLSTVYAKLSKPASRVLMEWSKEQSALRADDFAIYQPDGSYTAAYRKLTKDFYLKF